MDDRQLVPVQIFLLGGDCRPADLGHLKADLESRNHGRFVVRESLPQPAMFEELDPLRTVLVMIGCGSPSSTLSPDLIHSLRRHRFSLIVAYDPSKPYEDQAPAELRAVNGYAWAFGRSPAALTATLLRLVGVDEACRRVFLSYRRSCGSNIARQLRYSLLDDGWKVFLDTFSINPGADFQKELFRDLDGRSLLVVIEGPDTRNSGWVDDELAFATAHGIGIRAIVLPDLQDSELVARFPEDSCFRLDRLSVLDPYTSDPLLVDSAMTLLMSSLQSANTFAYRLRVEDMVVNVAGFLSDRGYSVTRENESLVVGRRGPQTEVVIATGQRPSLADVRLASSGVSSQAPGETARGWIVHRLTDPDPEYIAMLDWVAAPHRVHVVRLVDFDRRLAS